jgi:hypothetical protein
MQRLNKLNQIFSNRILICAIEPLADILHIMVNIANDPVHGKFAFMQMPDRHLLSGGDKNLTDSIGEIPPQAVNCAGLRLAVFITVRPKAQLSVPMILEPERDALFILEVVDVRDFIITRINDGLGTRICHILLEQQMFGTKYVRSCQHSYKNLVKKRRSTQGFMNS